MSIPKVEEKIRNIRELKNLTQEYMAEKLGITQAGYSKIENGSTSLSYNKLSEIANILEVNVEDIINFDSQRYFNSFNNVKGSNNGSINITTTENFDLIKELYEKQITLLEKLLASTENELQQYKDRFGSL